MVEADIGKDGKSHWKDGDGQEVTIHRKRGRPRKGMERLLPPEPKKEPVIKEEKPKEPVKGYSSLLLFAVKGWCQACNK